MNIPPFPRPFYKYYSIAGLLTGFSISFILLVFQPFGTSSFVHPHKNLILSGYGIVVGLAICVYYYLSINYFTKSFQDRWTIIHEMIDYFFAALFGMVLTYLYYIRVFDQPFRWINLLYFLKVAVSVNFIPMAVLGIIIYLKYQDVVRSELSFQPVVDQTDHTYQKLTLRGSTQKDVINTDESRIIMCKAEDNYVIIHLLLNDQSVKKHMIRSSLTNLKDQLPGHFFVKCHRSYIFNKQHIKEIIGSKSSAKISLHHISSSVPISRSKYNEVTSMLQVM